MYRLKQSSIDEFKLIRAVGYASLIGINDTFVSSILNANKPCSEMLARSMISVRFNISLQETDKINELLEKHFIKEK